MKMYRIKNYGLETALQTTLLFIMPNLTDFHALVQQTTKKKSKYFLEGQI